MYIVYEVCKQVAEKKSKMAAVRIFCEKRVVAHCSHIVQATAVLRCNIVDTFGMIWAEHVA